MFKVPIIILTKERPLQLKRMIDSISKTTPAETYELIIVDNSSVCPNLKKYLHELEALGVRVIYNTENKCLLGFQDGLALVKIPYVICSDPDIELNPNLPKDWINVFISILENHNVPKVGFALNTTFPERCKEETLVQRNECQAWQQPIRIPQTTEQCYIANTDTTFCMYRKDSYPLFPCQSIRVAGTFIAEHLGWNMTKEFTEELRFYSKNCLHSVASTIRYMVAEGLL